MGNEGAGALGGFSARCAFQKSLAFNKPYEYKGVPFYPVGLGDIIEFYQCLDVLTVRQERARDKKLMKLPYLWFLVYACANWQAYGRPEYGMFVQMLLALLELVTHETDIEIKADVNDEGNLRKCLLVVAGVEFDYKDFQAVRQIIFAQAGIEHSDEYLNADAERAINEGRDYERKKSGYVPPSIENLIDLVGMYLHMVTDEVVRGFTIRKFNNIIKYMSKFEEYKLLKNGEYSGMVTFKEKIPHWMGGFEKYDMFSDQNTDYKNSSLYKV